MQIPEIIPPTSLVRIIDADDRMPKLKAQLGRQFRIGYYRPRDGLDVIWLVDDEGNYCETTNRKFLLRYFEIESIASEGDYFGKDRPPLGPL